MAVARIEVAGRFVFADATSEFQFEDGATIDLSVLHEYESSQKILLAIMGVGFQQLLNAIPKASAEAVESDMANVVKEAERQMAAAQKKVEEHALQTMQGKSNA